PQAANLLGPPENLLHSFAQLLTGLITQAPGRPAIEPAHLSVLYFRDVRLDPVLATEPDDLGAVITLVGTHGLGRLLGGVDLAGQQLGGGGALGGAVSGGDFCLHAQAVAIFHQRMESKAQPSFFSAALANQLGLPVGGALVSG